MDFLVFKDINCSGRTIAHHRACPNVGVTSSKIRADKVRCSLRHAEASMRIGIVLLKKLRKAIQEIGRTGIYDSSTTKGEFTNSKLIH